MHRPYRRTADEFSLPPVRAKSPYDRAGTDYVTYADGDSGKLFAFTSLHAYADKCVWAHLDAQLRSLKAEGRTTVRILDAGCGPGTWLRRIVAHAHWLGFAEIRALGAADASRAGHLSKLVASRVFSLPRKPRRRTSTPEVLLRCPLRSQRGRRFRQPAARRSGLGHGDRKKDAKDSELQLLARYGQNDCVMGLGRRNWLFADTVKGAKASAMLYSIVSTARANGLEPYAYLRRLFAQLPKAKTVDDFEALLPFNAALEPLP